MAPEVGAFLRSRKNNLETIPMFLGASTAKWNIKTIKIDGVRTRVSYIATNPRADVRAFVEAALAHAEKDVPTTNKGCTLMPSPRASCGSTPSTWRNSET